MSLRIITLIVLLSAACSSEKKLRGQMTSFPDNDERISHDWNGDGIPEVIQIQPIRGGGEYRELAVYLGVLGDSPKELVFSNRHLIPRRAKPGAKLRMQRDSSFHLTVDASASGRIAEVLVWKINYRKGRYVLTGITRDLYDKLDPNDHKSCNVDLKNGRGMKNGRPVKFEPLSVDLLDLNERFIPTICEF